MNKFNVTSSAWILSHKPLPSIIYFCMSIALLSLPIKIRMYFIAQVESLVFLNTVFIPDKVTCHVFEWIQVYLCVDQSILFFSHFLYIAHASRKLNKPKLFPQIFNTGSHGYNFGACREYDHMHDTWTSSINGTQMFIHRVTPFPELRSHHYNSASLACLLPISPKLWDMLNWPWSN